SALDARESAFELHANGGMPTWRARLRRIFDDYNTLANGVLRQIDVPMPEIDMGSIRAAPVGPRRPVEVRPQSWRNTSAARSVRRRFRARASPPSPSLPLKGGGGASCKRQRCDIRNRTPSPLEGEGGVGGRSAQNQAVHRTRQGRLGSKVQPGMRNCIAMA